MECPTGYTHALPLDGFSIVSPSTLPGDVVSTAPFVILFVRHVFFMVLVPLRPLDPTTTVSIFLRDFFSYFWPWFLPCRSRLRRTPQQQLLNFSQRTTHHGLPLWIALGSLSVRPILLNLGNVTRVPKLLPLPSRPLPLCYTPHVPTAKTTLQPKTFLRIFPEIAARRPSSRQSSQGTAA